MRPSWFLLHLVKCSGNVRTLLREPNSRLLARGDLEVPDFHIKLVVFFINEQQQWRSFNIQLNIESAANAETA